MLFTSTSPAVEVRQVKGRVVDEQEKPLANVKWRITGLEEFREGKWFVANRTGVPYEDYTDANGCFVLKFREKLRYDLEFDKPGLGQAFVYQVAADSPELTVVIKKGILISGTINRLSNGVSEPVFGMGLIELRLPNGRGIWYQKQLFSDSVGRFACYVCPPPVPPDENVKSVTGEIHIQKSIISKWQVVLAGEVVQIDVVEDKPIPEIHFEIQVNVTRGQVRPQS